MIRKSFPRSVGLQSNAQGRECRSVRQAGRSLRSEHDACTHYVLGNKGCYIRNETKSKIKNRNAKMKNGEVIASWGQDSLRVGARPSGGDSCSLNRFLSRSFILSITETGNSLETERLYFATIPGRTISRENSRGRPLLRRSLPPFL